MLSQGEAAAIRRQPRAAGPLLRDIARLLFPGPRRRVPDVLHTVAARAARLRASPDLREGAHALHRASAAQAAVVLPPAFRAPLRVRRAPAAQLRVLRSALRTDVAPPVAAHRGHLRAPAARLPASAGLRRARRAPAVRLRVLRPQLRTDAVPPAAAHRGHLRAPVAPLPV